MERVIGLIGLNYRCASLEIRSLMAFSEEQNVEFIKSLKQLEAVAGVVVISTCNRTEIYFHIKNHTVQRANDLILSRILEYKNLSESVVDHLYFKNGLEAVQHLFQVASGLDSLIIGEDQIIGQVKNAFLLSDHEHCAGPVLTRLFNRSFSAGKQVRTETKINEGCASVSSAAASLAKQHMKEIASRSALLIGAGQTGRLSMMSLIENGCKDLFITNRTHERAVEVAKEFNATAVPFSNIREYLVPCDIVMLATGSPIPLIDAEMINEVMPLRNHRPMVILDLSVPKNVANDVENCGEVTLFDIDDTGVIIKETIEKRKTEIIKAEEIVAALARDYMEWLASISLSPTIRQIQENFRKINEIEFENYRKFKEGVDRNPFKEYGNHISDKFSRILIENLKQITDNGKKVEHLKMFNDLFEMISANGKN